MSVTLDQAQAAARGGQGDGGPGRDALKAHVDRRARGGRDRRRLRGGGDSISDGNVHNPVVTVDSGPLIVSAHLPGTAIGEVRPGSRWRSTSQPLQLRLPGKVVAGQPGREPVADLVSYTVICQIDAQALPLMACMTVNIMPQ